MRELINNPFALDITESPGSPPPAPTAIRPHPTPVDRANGFLDRFFLIQGNFFQETDLEGFQGWIGEKARVRWHIRPVGGYTAQQLNLRALNAVIPDFPILGVLTKYTSFLVE